MRKILRFSLRYLLPVALLGYILSRIDYSAFPGILQEASLVLVLIFLLNNPVKYLLFAIRWLVMTGILTSKKLREIHFPFLYKTVYKGLFLGYFVPGALGVDIYRIFKTGKKYGSYEMQTGFVFIEKIMGILAFSLMILITYPFVKTNLPVEVTKVVEFSFLVAFGLFLFIVLLFLVTKRQSIIKKLLKWFKTKLDTALTRTVQRVSKNEKAKVSSGEILAPLLNLKVLTISFGISIFIQIIGALFVNLAFLAFGVDLPFVINLFLVPVMNLLFLLPVSFGGIGLRETAYVVLYGAFGVSEEIALLVAVTSFIYLIINNSVGGIIILAENIGKDTINKKVEKPEAHEPI
ncbi:MAG: lysylphosphatidylglycerol synthase transmembrane domain-containing protein [Bacteroidota bacterium]